MTPASRRPSVTSPPEKSDLDAIRDIFHDVETAFNDNDAELMNAHFAADGSAVNAIGARLSGIDALHEAAVSGLSGFLRDQYVRYEAGDVFLLRPDVAIAYKSAYATDSKGATIGVGHSMVAMYVLVKEQGRWWIAARQNTLVPDREPPAMR